MDLCYERSIFHFLYYAVIDYLTDYGLFSRLLHSLAMYPSIPEHRWHSLAVYSYYPEHSLDSKYRSISIALQYRYYDLYSKYRIAS